MFDNPTNRSDITRPDPDNPVTEEESNLLFKNGEAAAEKFLKNWDFQSWKEKYRKIALNGNCIN